MKVWGRLFRGEKCIRQTTVETLDSNQALQMLCRELDVPRPVVLGKHERELEQFGHTRFLTGDFVETLPGDRLTLEILPEKDKKKGR